MALQDLTPQLRTRLSRMERAVGWFVLLATVLLILGFGYYIYTTAESKGWFKSKGAFYTYAESGDGILVGDPIKLMGFPAGQITQVTAEEPRWGLSSKSNVFIGFEVVEPYYGYLWTEGSVAQLSEASLLGKRQLNLTKGTNGYALYVTRLFRLLSIADAGQLPNLSQWRLAEDVFDGTNRILKAWQPLSSDVLQRIAQLGQTNFPAFDTSVDHKRVTAFWDRDAHQYFAVTRTNRPVWLPQDESPPLTTRLQAVASQIETALPHFLELTNQLNTVLANSTRLTSNLNDVVDSARPMITNFAAISANLRDPHGSLGEWAFPTNIKTQLETTLQNANVTLTNANTNLAALSEGLGRTIDNLADITSNLNYQVQVNSNILSEVSTMVVHSDQFVQGLKHFWLFRHTFKKELATNAASAKPAQSAPQGHK